MGKVEYPSTFAEKLSGENVLIAVEADMTADASFGESWVLLTEKQLLVWQGTGTGQEIYTFKGSKNRNDAKESTQQNWNFSAYPIAENTELLIMRTVCGGVLIRKEEEREEKIAAFSNYRMGEMQRLKKLYEKCRSKEELTAEDRNLEEEEEYCPKCGMMYPEKNRKICPRCMNKQTIFRRLLGYLKPFKGKIVIMFLCYILTAILNLVWPYLNGTVLYDHILEKNGDFLAQLGLGDGQWLLALGLVVLSMFVTKLLMQFTGILQGALTATIVPQLVYKLTSDIFRSMGRLSVRFFNSKQTGGLMTRVLGDAEEITGFFIDGLPYLLINVLQIVAMAIVMFRLNWILALCTLFFLPVIFFVSWKMMPRQWHYYGRRHTAYRRMNSGINDNLTGSRVVKAFGQEKKEVVRLDKRNTQVKDAEVDVINYDSRYNALYSLFQQFSVLVAWGVGSCFILFQTDMPMELGVLITFAGYIGQMTGPLDFMSFIFRWYTNCMNCAQRMFEIIDAIPDITEKEDAIRPERIRGEVELRNVTFGYEKHKPVLKKINMKIEAGKMLGIVGRSGAGKTTLVNLISRLYDPDEGTVLLDGIDLKDLAFSSLYGNVAMVSQESYIFVGTVAENIAYARPEASRDEIIRAAVLASAHNFICRMPDGYDTMIGSSGRSLSGGERQRISIARAILANPRILILDEATASVDTETEQEIQQAINLLVKDRTTISIAHRLSTLRDADWLVVIDNGEVTESGTHEELLAQKGTYYKLKELQTKALALRE